MNEKIPLGLGIYLVPEAARLLGIPVATLRRWIAGYEYWLHRDDATLKRKLGPLIRSELPKINDTRALSFLELMELRVIRALIEDRGMSLQYVRQAHRVASELSQTSHPFASERIYALGKRVWAHSRAHGHAENFVELSDGGKHQPAIGQLLKPFLKEIDFDASTSLAVRFWPRGRGFPVVLDPAIAFGAPVVAGTATRTEVVAALANRLGADAAAAAYEIKLEKIEAAVQFEDGLRAA